MMVITHCLKTLEANLNNIYMVLLLLSVLESEQIMAQPVSDFKRDCDYDRVFKRLIAWFVH